MGFTFPGLSLIFIVIFLQKEEFMNLHLVGRCWPSILFARGWDRLAPSEESLASSFINEKSDSCKSLMLIS